LGKIYKLIYIKILLLLKPIYLSSWEDLKKQQTKKKLKLV
jgi:hypothetical protein